MVENLQFLVKEDDTFTKEKLGQDFNYAYPFYCGAYVL